MAKKKKSMGLKMKLKKEVAVPKKNLELLYMTEQKVNVKSFADILEKEANVEVNVWDQLEIMEFIMPSKEIADFETMTDYMDDEEDLSFMKERNVKTVYAITVSEEAFQEFKRYMDQIISQFGGFLCSDSDDFHPFY